MGALYRFAGLCVVLSLGAGCVASETRSVSNPSDIPAGKYRKVALFIENLDESERALAEQIVISALQSVGIPAISSSNLFRNRGPINPNTQASIIRKEGFDAVLYVTVLEKGAAEERVPNAYYDGNMVNVSMGFVTVGHSLTDLYVVKSDGSVYHPMLAMKTRSELQDVKSAKNVWAAETVATGHARTTNMSALFTQASQQITEKLRADQAI